MAAAVSETVTAPVPPAAVTTEVVSPVLTAAADLLADAGVVVSEVFVPPPTALVPVVIALRDEGALVLN